MVLIILKRSRIQLTVGLSKSNFQKSRHNFKDSINLMCPINDDTAEREL